MNKFFVITILFFNSLFADYLDVQFASFSYTIGGSYGSCVKFKKSEYNFSDYNECSCAWAANVSNYSDCYELYYNPQTKMIKYNLSEGGEYTYRNFSNDYTCHIYNEEMTILECSEMNETECSGDDSCDWVEDVDMGSCYDLTPIWDVVYYCDDPSTNSDNCYTYTCYGGGYGQWNTCCGGDPYIIADNSYCEETQMSSCSEFNEIGCEESAECQWTENIELESCNDINSQQQCNAVGCSWYNGNYYACSICCWGEYEVDNSYCEEMQYQLGDINQDNTINVQDVILTVNLVLNVEYNNSADMNSDNILNVLDIIQLVNMILN